MSAAEQSDHPSVEVAASPVKAETGSVPELIGVGSPLVDFIVHVDDDFLAREVPGGKGGMQMVDAAHIAGLIDKAGGTVTRAPGGAAANTTVGAAALGLRTAFVGSAGADELGRYFAASLGEVACESRLLHSEELPTGHVLSLVTPDAQRTMRTCLGAALALAPDRFSPDIFAGSRMVMLEGYTLFNHELTRAIARAAKAAGCELALDLASFEVVQANRGILEELLAGQVDLVFANEDEARAWHPDLEQALADLGRRTTVAVVKLGAEGALIQSGAERHRVEAEKVPAVVDTTGAGDNWAAGFLAGYLRGLPLDRCGRLGSHAGAAVVQKLGAQPDPADWRRLRGWLDAWA